MAENDILIKSYYVSLSTSTKQKLVLALVDQHKYIHKNITSGPLFNSIQDYIINDLYTKSHPIADSFIKIAEKPFPGGSYEFREKILSEIPSGKCSETTKKSTFMTIWLSRLANDTNSSGKRIYRQYSHLGDELCYIS
jgi:hypothetical protein